MNSRSYAPASAPDIVARLRDLLDANDTTRVLLAQGEAARHRPRSLDAG